MKLIRPLSWLASVLVVLSLLVSPALAQRIPIEEETQTKPARTDTESARPSPSRRIIPPEDFGKFREQDDADQLSRRATIEKLRADSAAMRVRFQERLRSVLADSRQMRSTIRTLQSKIEDLQDQLRRTSDTQPRVRRSAESSGSDGISGQDSSGSSSGIQTSRSRSTSSGSGSSQWTQGTKLNPNQASLEELKSVPGMTDRIAERIQWYRENVRTYRDIQDLRRVPGIDRQLYNEISSYFYEGPYQ